MSKAMRDVQWSFISIAIFSLVHFLLRVVLGKELGASGLGLYTFVFTIYMFGMLFATFGIGVALTKYIAEFKEDVPRTHILVSSGSGTAILIGCAMGLILYVLSDSIAGIFDMPELGELLHILAIVFPFIALEKATLGFLNGLRRMALFAFINIAQNGLIFILTIILVFAGYGVSGAVVALVLPVIPLSLFSLFSIRRFTVKPTLKQYFPAIKMLLVFGGYVVLASGIDTIQTYTDSIMIVYFMTETDLGYYSVAIVLSQAMLLIPRAIQMITTPTISIYHGKGEIDKIEDLVNRVMKYTAALIVPIGFIAAFFSHQIIVSIFGEDFSPAVLPLQILLIGTVCLAVSASVGGILASTGHVDVIFEIGAVVAIINVILNILLIPFLGINGAAIATTLSMLVLITIHIHFTQLRIGIKIHLKWFASLILFTTFLAMITYGLGMVVNTYVSVCLAIIIFFVVILKYFITKGDLVLIKENLR